MKNKFLSLMMTFVIAWGIIIPSYAESDSDTTDYVNVHFYEDNEEGSDEIVPYAVQKEKEYEDGVIFDAPKGSAGFNFRTDSGDNKLNVYFKNKSNVKVTLTLFKKSGFGGEWEEVKSTSISADRENYFQVIPNHNFKYRVEVSNSTGDKILGTLRVRSFRG